MYEACTKFGHVSFGRDQIDGPLVVFDLPVGDFVEYIFDQIHIIRIEYVARLELALGVGLDRKQLRRVSCRAVAVATNDVEQWREQSRCRHALGKLPHK